jgi:hypothetical protein
MIVRGDTVDSRTLCDLFGVANMGGMPSAGDPAY